MFIDVFVYLKIAEEGKNDKSIIFKCISKYMKAGGVTLDSLFEAAL